MRRPSHTPTSLQTHACRLISLHTGPTTLGHNHTSTFWRASSFTRRSFYTRTLLHTNPNTHTPTHTHAHTHTYTHTYTHTRTHTHPHRRSYMRSFYTQLHTPTFSHAIFTHKGFFYFMYAPLTHTHAHRHHPRSIFSPMTNDLYFLFFVFLRNQFSAKKSCFCLLPNPISSNVYEY